MDIVVNGEARTLEEGATVQTLVDALGLRAGTVVVQRNDEIVERAKFEATPLSAGDTVEIVRLVGGG
jgi:thiamine biosynthesis protein ThiS